MLLAVGVVLDCEPADVTWAACARINAKSIDECSGIVQSRRFPGVLWVHNDSGDTARFFAIDAKGALLNEYAVDGARNVDWEDITIDDAGRLYIGDFGNNRNNRRDLAVYVVDEPDPRTPSPLPVHVPVVRRIPFHYPDQTAFPDSAHFNFDCEAVFWNAGHLYLLTKHRSDIQTTLYRLDPAQESEQVAERLGQADIGSPVTGADCAADGKRIVVLSYQYLHLFERPPQGDDFVAGKAHATLIEGRQCEGVCFDGERILFTNEQREIYCVPISFLQTHDRYLPRPPEVRLPHVEPVVDGVPNEWRGSAGRLTFDRFHHDSPAPSGGQAAHAAAVDSVEVRAGWCAQGLLLYARWIPAPVDAEDRDEPVLYLMMGGSGGSRPCLEANQRAWGVFESGGGFELRPIDAEAGVAPCAAPAALGLAPRCATRRLRREVAFEALVPVVGRDSLVANITLGLNVVLRDARADDTGEVAWAAVLDMQPLGNPLLWGRAILDAAPGTRTPR